MKQGVTPLTTVRCSAIPVEGDQLRSESQRFLGLDDIDVHDDVDSKAIVEAAPFIVYVCVCVCV